MAEALKRTGYHKQHSFTRVYAEHLRVRCSQSERGIRVCLGMHNLVRMCLPCAGHNLRWEGGIHCLAVGARQ